MSGLDIGTILVALLGAFIGLKIGAVSAFFCILGGFLGGWVSGRFSLFFSQWIPHSPSVSYLVSFLIVAGGFMFMGVVFSRILETFFLGVLDRIAGAVLGMGFGIVFMTMVSFPLALSSGPSLKEIFHRSSLTPYLMRFSQEHFHMLPTKFWDTVSPAIESEQVRRIRKLIAMSIP